MHDRIVRATIASGTVEGFTRDGVNRWRSIPYARAPIGPLRFRAPQPPEPWRGCAALPHVCQLRPATAHLHRDRHRQIPADERGLPDAQRGDARAPSGRATAGDGLDSRRAYILGSSATPIFDGAALARRGCVYVLVNYLTGDQQAALTLDFAQQPRDERWGYIEEDGRFVDAICGVGEPAVTAADAFGTTQLVERCYTAAREADSASA